MESEIKHLENCLISFSNQLGNLEGEYNLLNKQISTSKKNISTLEEQRKIDLKAIEVLNLVSKSTRDVIKNTFEGLVSYALKAIYQDSYEFKLKFGNRGNLSELDFELKSPKNLNPLPLEDCAAGGGLDIISLALRFVLIQILQFPGMIVLDEPTKHLSVQFRQNEFNFYNYIAKKLGKQLIIITHSKELVDLAENKILIGE